MKKLRYKVSITYILLLMLSSCGEKIKTNADKVYSRHLQEQVNLTVFATPLDNKEAVSLLLLCNALSSNKLTEITLLNLYKNKMITNAVVVEISSEKITDMNERSIEKYFSFIDKELLPFIKKKSGIRKFKSISIAGNNGGGELAIGFAWEHADKIQKAISINAFGDTTNNFMLNYIFNSRKRPDCSVNIYEAVEKINSDSSYAARILSAKKSLTNNLEYLRYSGKKNKEAIDSLLPEIFTKTLSD